MKKEMMVLAVGMVALIIAMVVALVGLSIGVGFDEGVRSISNTSVTGITVAANDSITYFGTSYPYITDITDCVNSSDATNELTAANYTIFTGSYSNDANSGFILKDSGASFVGETINCSSVTYKPSTSASNQIPYFLAGIVVVSGFIGLIALIMIGAVMIGMVVQYMKFSKNK